MRYTNSFSHFGWLKLFLFFLMLLPWLAACNSNAAPTSAPLTEFNQNGVTVRIVLEQDVHGGTALTATFTPDEEDAHLYSMDLPLEGVDGLGRPTRLALAPGTSLQASGDLQTAAVAESIIVAPDLLPLPVYPAGPVVLRLPVQLPESTRLEQVLVTYMACSPRGCYRPVIEKAVDIQLP